jgi:YVTN family beta-propeller protein
MSADGGVVSKIDASSRTVEATVEVEGHPYGLAVGEGFVWATSVDAGLLTRIDPDSL